MKLRMTSRNKALRWKNLEWKYGYLSPEIKDSEGVARFREDNRFYEETRKYLTIKGKEFGKVTDCGYDAFACCCAEIPFCNEAVIEIDYIVRSFPPSEELTGQEAFGLFLRDTMKAEPLTGQCYSNMAAIGAWGGSLNFFGRSGITRTDHSHVRQFWAAREKVPPGLDTGSERVIHAYLRMDSGKVYAAMSDSSGYNLLEEISRHNSGRDVSYENGQCSTEMDAGSLCCLERDCFYIGLFATHNAEIKVMKDSFRLSVGDKAFAVQNQGCDFMADDPFSSPPVSDACVMAHYAESEILWADPDGSAEGNGRAESPYDLATAIKKCRPGNEVRLNPGNYCLADSLILDGDADTVMGRKLIRCADQGGRVVIDFCDTDSSLCIVGDNWDVEGIAVTRGMGIQIRGNNNRLYRCTACANHETGILIRHEDDYSPRIDWPSYNVVEECVSYGNCDRSGHNADGFACKVAAGEGNRFLRCVAFLNSDDGFDLFAKNRKTGAVEIDQCESYLNGYKIDDSGEFTETKGNGNGFKLGGSGERVEHIVRSSVAQANRKYGFTNNSNPFMKLISCEGHDNGQDMKYYTHGTDPEGAFDIESCSTGASEDFDTTALLHELIDKYEG